MTEPEAEGDAERRVGDSSKSGGGVTESDVAVRSPVPLRRDFRLLALPAIRVAQEVTHKAQGRSSS